jgi:hypothetical protein
MDAALFLHMKVLIVVVSFRSLRNVSPCHGLNPQRPPAAHLLQRAGQLVVARVAATQRRLQPRALLGAGHPLGLQRRRLRRRRRMEPSVRLVAGEASPW